MSRAPSLIRNLPSTSRSVVPSPSRLPSYTRTILTGPTPSSRSSTSSRGSVDFRVFDGIENFLPKSNFERLNQWQAGLWERLQGEVRNNPELQEIKQDWDRGNLNMIKLLTVTSRESSLTLAFNWASLLLNNSYFLEGLNPETPQSPPSEFLGDTQSALENKLASYAEGVVGSSWLWLVRSPEGPLELDVVSTFGSGTLLVSNRSQRGRDDTPLHLLPKSSDPSSKSTGESESSSTSQVRKGHGRIDRSHSSDKGVRPVAVLNLFESAYLGDKYGVWSKGQYARDWFKSLNWDVVRRRAAL